MLPILGPSTSRDTVAGVANFMGGDPWYNVVKMTHNILMTQIYTSKGATGVDFRAKNFIQLKI